MTAIIVYPSALEYWLFDRGIPYSHFINPQKNRRNSFNFFHQAFGRASLHETMDTLNFTSPVHVAVPHIKHRNNSRAFVFHTLSAHIPPDSFIQINKDVYLSSPEMCFLQAARHLTIPELVVLANELCATYIEDPFSTSGQRNRDPITSVSLIKQFLEHAGSCHGILKAKQAIQYASDNSNSPMESILAALASLPLHNGGYALVKFLLNYSMTLTKDGKEDLKRESLRGDFVWPVQKIAVEYDSKLTHLNLEQFYYDKKRESALSAAGYRVIQITSDNVKSFSSIEKTFLMLRNVLGMKTHPDRMQKYFEIRYEVVRNIMFGKPDNFRRRRSTYFHDEQRKCTGFAEDF